MNLLTKEEFNKFKTFFIDNFDLIKQYPYEEKTDDDEYINELIETEEETKRAKERTKEEEIIYRNKLLIRKLDKILKYGIEICELSSQMTSEEQSKKSNKKTSKEESKKIWQSLISAYYELINEIKTEIINKKIISELGNYLIKELENRAGEITEKMNSYFDLNSVLLLISQIQGDSFGSKEYKSLLKRLLFNGEYFNRILQNATSLIKDSIFDYNKDYKIISVKGNFFDFEKCDYCFKKFKETDKNSILVFNCGHKCHEKCCKFTQDYIYCKFCLNNENINEEIGSKEENEINLPEEEEDKDKRNNSFHKKINMVGINSKNNRDKNKKLKLINDINGSYFELSKIFESN